MKKSARDSAIVAAGIFVLLSLALIAYLGGKALRDKAPASMAPDAQWVPPGWVSPSTPPPSSR